VVLGRLGSRNASFSAPECLNLAKYGKNSLVMGKKGAGESYCEHVAVARKNGRTEDISHERQAALLSQFLWCSRCNSLNDNLNFCDTGPCERNNKHVGGHKT